MKTEKDFYTRLKEELSQTSKWPSLYLYKFIIPCQEDKIQQMNSIFHSSDAEIETQRSSSGKYISYSIKMVLPNPDAVIEYYKKVSVIEGIISL